VKVVEEKQKEEIKGIDSKKAVKQVEVKKQPAKKQEK